MNAESYEVTLSRRGEVITLILTQAPEIRSQARWQGKWWLVTKIGWFM